MIVLDNVLSNSSRKKFIKNVKPFLIDGKELYKHNNGKDGEYQEGSKWFNLTQPDLHKKKEFSFIHTDILYFIRKKVGLDLTIKRSWVNLTTGKLRSRYRYWHEHGDFDFSFVYYMKIFPLFSNGTLFKHHGFVKAKQNSCLIFPSTLLHTTPSSPLPFKRNTWAMDLNISR